MNDHDPFNELAGSHPRARELMTEGFFKDCVDEEAPFGSDEGHDAYYEFREWRRANQENQLTDCLAWIMSGEELKNYNDGLCSDEAVDRALEKPAEAFLADAYDMFALDATIIATCLAQLLDEGKIDPAAKPYARVAIKRQLHPKVVTSEHRGEILLAIRRVIDAA